VEHLAAIQLLSKALHCRQPDIGLSGIKDMHAVTYQFCTIRNHDVQHQLHSSPTNCIIRQHARDFLQSRGVEISQNVYKVDWLLQKGALQGNRFEIVLQPQKRFFLVMEIISKRL
jgi:tRNA(Glu) U13 pseudouridine synthase TruD